MVQMDFIGRPSCTVNSVCEKFKNFLGLAFSNPLQVSFQEVTVATLFFPCSGNGNGSSWNNRGSNGNYWSSSLNSQTNGRNLNFNSGGVNPQNNNNRFNGFAVRPVQQSLQLSFFTFNATRLLWSKLPYASAIVIQNAF